jgi:Cys-tRNA(Pro) deacylase
MRSDDTAAIAELRGAAIDHTVVRTARPSSVEESAALQGIDRLHLLKSLLVRRGADDYVFVLVPGPRKMSWPKLRRALGLSRISMPSAGEAFDVTGYERGAITPLGAKAPLPVFLDASAPPGTIAIGGGAHGVNVHLERDDLVAHLGATIADLSDP